MWWWAWWPGPGLLTPPAWPPSACTGGAPGGARPGAAPWWQSSRSVAGAAAGDQWGSGAETWQQHSYLPRWAISPLYIYCIYFVYLLYLFCTSTVSSSHIYFVYLPYLPHLLCISTVTLYIYYLPYLCLLSTAGWAIQNPGGGCVGPSQPALAQLQAGILILDGMDTLRLSI